MMKVSRDEKSLNGLMGLEQIEKVFDKDVIFEIKSIFTESTVPPMYVITLHMVFGAMPIRTLGAVFMLGG